jgi:hypothetical protein
MTVTCGLYDIFTRGYVREVDERRSATERAEGVAGGWKSAGGAQRNASASNRAARNGHRSSGLQRSSNRIGLWCRPPMMHSSRIAALRRLLALSVIALVCIAACGGDGELVHAFLYLLPALSLLLVLAARSYPGERALLAVIERKRRVGNDLAAGLLSTVHRLCVFLPRGGRLIASSLAERPPPALSAVSPL